MNLYHCMFDLEQESKALAFADALDTWMSLLRDRGAIRDWRLMRLKLNLASDCCRDFLLEIEVDDLGQLDQAFRLVSSKDDEIAAAYARVHTMVGPVEYGLYRPFPDPERAERVALL